MSSHTGWMPTAASETPNSASACASDGTATDTVMPSACCDCARWRNPTSVAGRGR
jgi:hypothetical protein